MKKLYLSILIIILFSGVSSVCLAGYGTILPDQSHTFGDRLGWINFGCDNCDVHITDTALTGYAWSKQYGWINLSPDNAGVRNQCIADVGRLSGKAWSKSLGWLDFTGATIDGNGIFKGETEGVLTKAGKINFNCDNCDVATNFRCSSPAQVLINSITDVTTPTVSASITISNEGFVNTEYQYEWCVVSDIANSCGGGDDIFYASAAKLINAGENWQNTLNATVPNTGTYYFKLVVHFGDNYSVASQEFTAVTPPPSGGGGGGGGGGGAGGDLCPNIMGSQSTIPFGYVLINGLCVLPLGTGTDYDTADLNRDHVVDSIDFSILLFYWKKNGPYKNIYVDINKDGKVNSVDFSIMLSQWGRKTI